MQFVAATWYVAMLTPVHLLAAAELVNVVCLTDTLQRVPDDSAKTDLAHPDGRFGPD